jgi:hypothetical protein
MNHQVVGLKKNPTAVKAHRLAKLSKKWCKQNYFFIRWPLFWLGGAFLAGNDWSGV